MKKRVIATMAAATMVAALFAGCTGTSSSSSAASSAAASSAAASSATDSSAADSSAADSSESEDLGSGEITIWVAEAVVDTTKKLADDFIKSDDKYSGYTVTIEAVGEGDAATNMITDVEGGADIFGFAQDQLARLVAAGAVNPVVGDYYSFVESSNDAGSVAATKVGDTAYAFPMTSDNGYFLYYDKSVITDVSTLDAVVKQCEDAGKSLYFQINSGWYNTAFFFGAGCTVTYETDEDGNFTGCTCDYDSENGVEALEAMIKLASSSAFVNGSSASDAVDYAAIVDGTWDKTTVKDYFGDNYACAKLPTFTCGDEQVQLSGFGGFKLLGVKPQTDAGKLKVCLDLAKWLTNADSQLARYEAVGWGPSNLEAQASEAVQEDEALAALGAQLAYTIPQGQYPNDYWSIAEALGNDVIAGTINADSDLMAALEDVVAKFKALAK